MHFVRESEPDEQFRRIGFHGVAIHGFEAFFDGTDGLLFLIR